MLDLLIQRYGKTDRFGTPRYQFIEHPKTYYKRHRRTLDALALDRHSTKVGTKRLYLRHAVEVKCSRSDLMRELREPDKAAAWQKFAHSFWLAVPDKAIYRGLNIPDSWGLLAPRNGKLFANRTAEINPSPNPIDGVTLNNLLWAAIKTDRRQNAWEDQTAPLEPQDLALNA